jgi:hypothetical protein
MISHARFGKLRLAQFLTDVDIAELDDWEFMDAIWVGEAVGFSEWLRLKSDPDVLRSLAIGFTEIPETIAIRILHELDLPIRAGMRIGELQTLFGAPVAKQQYTKDRISYDFKIAKPRYDLSCAVLNKGGLTYLVVMRPLPRRSGIRE